MLRRRRGLFRAPDASCRSQMLVRSRMLCRSCGGCENLFGGDSQETEMDALQEAEIDASQEPDAFIARDSFQEPASGAEEVQEALEAA